MMKVTAVNNGVVIDHITAGKCMKLYQFLDLDHVDATIAPVSYTHLTLPTILLV